MPDETEEDIIESIENLKYLRFFLHCVDFRHILTPVEVNTISRYYPKIKEELNIWEPSKLVYKFLVNEIDSEHCWDIFSHIKPAKHFLWDAFLSIEKYYLDNKYSYSLDKEEDSCRYSESINGRIVKEIIFDCESIEWIILKSANNHVVSIDDICLSVQNEFVKDDIFIEVDNIKNVVTNLKKEGILFCTPDYTEIISVINVN